MPWEDAAVPDMLRDDQVPPPERGDEGDVLSDDEMKMDEDKPEEASEPDFVDEVDERRKKYVPSFLFHGPSLTLSPAWSTTRADALTLRPSTSRSQSHLVPHQVLAPSVPSGSYISLLSQSPG